MILRERFEQLQKKIAYCDEKNRIFIQKLKILTLERIFAVAFKNSKNGNFQIFCARASEFWRKIGFFTSLQTKFFRGWSRLIAEFSFLGLPTNQWFSP